MVFIHILMVGNRASERSPGVQKKLKEQREALERLGHTVDYTIVAEDKIELVREKQTHLLASFPKKPVKHAYWRIITSLKTAEQAIPLALNFAGGYDMLYIRKPVISKYFIKALRYSKRKYPGTVLVLEFPTYPYDDEMESAIQRKKTPYSVLPYKSDKKWRHKLAGLVDWAVTVEDSSKVFGLPAINIENGVDISSLPVSTPDMTNGEVHLAAVSTLKTWHGYDRLIKGMGNYRKNGGKTRYILHMVGEGPLEGEWKALAKQQGVEQDIIFYGSKTGTDLDDIMALCHIAVSSLGEHRRGLAKNSALKNREYIGRGMPVLYAADDDVLDGLCEYCLQFPKDDSDIDMHAIDRFTASLPSDASVQLRQLAAERCGWDAQLAKVLNAINKNK